MSTKETLRKKYIAIRKDLKAERRDEARRNALFFLQARLASFQKILSFTNTKDEIDLTGINEWLCREKKLYLPKMCENELLIFRVRDLASELVLSKRFSIREPNSHLCTAVDLSSIDCILVPALAFDDKRTRLGYGQGFYDRLLEKTSAYSIGVGFKEQMSRSLLPQEAHDRQLFEIALF